MPLSISAMGTPGHARVRVYLLNTLRALGLDPQVQEATVVSEPTNPQSPAPSGAMFGLASRVGYAYNVMARLRGKQPGKARPGKAGGPNVGPAAFRPRKAVLLRGAVAATAIRNEAPTAGQPLHSQVSYFMNADTKRAVWASYGLLETDDWNRQFFPKATTGKLTEIHPQAQPADGRIYLKSPAPALTARPPIASIVSDVTTGSGRRLELELTSPRGAANLEITLLPGQAGHIRGVRVNGEPVPVRVQQTTSGPAFDLLFFGLPVTKKVALTIELTGTSPLRLLLFDQSIGLPLNFVKIPRPAHVVPEQGRMSNLTIINKMYQF